MKIKKRQWMMFGLCAVIELVVYWKYWKNKF